MLINEEKSFKLRYIPVMSIFIFVMKFGHIVELFGIELLSSINNELDNLLLFTFFIFHFYMVMLKYIVCLMLD